MTDKKINRWQDTVTPRDKAPQPWTVKSGGSWDMLDVQPIPDEMLAELARDYHRLGTPWNCRSLPLSPNDREYMFLLYYSMQGLVARMRAAENRASELEAARATAEQSAFALQMLVAAGHVSQAKVDEALSIAASTPGIRAASRDSVIDLCAKAADTSMLNCGCASKIRALKSQQDAAIESKPAEQSLWQPIETAPKTGRTLLLGYPNSLGNWRTVRGEWLTQEYIDQNWEEPDEAEAGWYETSVEADDVPSCWPITPTHWQPLPKPPADASQRSGDGS